MLQFQALFPSPRTRRNGVLLAFQVILLLGLVWLCTCVPTAAVGDVIFFDNFATSRVGQIPTGWQMRGTAPKASIVATAGVESGKAVQIVADGLWETTTELLSPWWGAPWGDPKTIAVDLKVYWQSGSSIDMYVLGRDGYHLDWFISRNGDLLFSGETIARLQRLPGSSSSSWWDRRARA